MAPVGVSTMGWCSGTRSFWRARCTLGAAGHMRRQEQRAQRCFWVLTAASEDDVAVVGSDGAGMLCRCELQRLGNREQTRQQAGSRAALSAGEMHIRVHVHLLNTVARRAYR